MSTKTQTIIDCIKDVHDTIGYGLSEATYQKALTLTLKEKFNIVEREKSVPIIYKNHEITALKADIVVNNEYIIELKAVTTKLSEKDKNQLNRYLKVLKISKGILVNFTKDLEIIQLEI